MSRPSGSISSKILSIILAGGRGSRLYDLTDTQAKPALPVGPAARLIDFTLANIVNSGIDRALVLTQFAPDGLHRHLETVWRPLGTARGFSFDTLDGKARGSFDGTADAVRKVTREIDRETPDHVIVLGGDHLYQMDYRPFIARHVRSGAAMTVGAVHVPLEDASEFGVMALDALGRIVAFEEKPSRPAEAQDKPGFALASMGIYVFEWAVLRALLENLAQAHDDLDFGKHILPILVAGGGAYAYALPGRGQAAPLWRDLGTLDAYHGVHADLASGAVPLDPSWPLLVGQRHAGSLRAADEPADPPRRSGCCVGDGATVGTGSVLRNVVVLPGARIGRDVLMSNAIVTGDAIVPDGFDLERALALGSPWCTVSEGGIKVVSGRALRALSDIAAASFDPARDRLNDNPPGAPWAAQPSCKLLAAPCG